MFKKDTGYKLQDKIPDTIDIVSGIFISVYTLLFFQY